MHRRDVLQGAGGILAGLLLQGSGSKPPPPKDPPTPTVSKLVDAHCHVFNGSDLPTVRFIKIVVLQHFPRQAVPLRIDDPDALDGLLALLTAILGRTGAPTAEEELKVLQDRSRVCAASTNSSENEGAILDAIESFHAAAKEWASDSGTRPVPAAPGEVSRGAAIAITNAIQAAASTPVPAGPIPGAAPRSEAERAYRSNTDLGRYLRWFGLFTRYRHVLAQDLVNAHGRQGFDAQLLCPATVDFDHWLREYVQASPLPRQVAVMGALARRTSGPVVHGYVGFDPLRQAYFAAGKFRDYDPLGLVRQALREHGFIGVKLYPPMGFKPIGNKDDPCETYHKRIVDDFASPAPADPAEAQCNPRPGPGSRAIGQRLDEAMAALFDVCSMEDACILAHANESNDGGQGYARRADPAFWLSVFREPKWKNLRICLAHFGHFASRSEAAPPGSVGAEASWEWTLGRYIKAARDPAVFADISFMTEIFRKAPAEMHSYAATFRRWISDFDPECRHLLFGTDWTMLGTEPSYEVYTKSVYEFFRTNCEFDRERLNRLYFLNAGRFLGLRSGDAARTRLLNFYAKYNIPASRLPVL